MVVFRTLLFYLFLIAVIRLMGKRQVGQMEPSEFAVTMFLANLASIPVEKMESSMKVGLAAMATVLLLERSLSWVSLRSIPMRRLLCGKPVILIDNGKLLYRNLRRTRINLDELSAHLRELGFLEIQSVQFAILETNGSVTAFPYAHLQPADAHDAGIQVKPQEMPYTIISDAKVLMDNLHLLGKDRPWLQGFLSGKSQSLENVVLMTLTPSGKTHLICRGGSGADGEISS